VLSTQVQSTRRRASGAITQAYAKPVAARTYLLEEANRALPRVRRLTERIVELTHKLPELEDELRIAEYRARRPEAAAEDRRRYEEAADRMGSAEEELVGAVGRLDELGVRLKDPSIGLVDFLSYLEGELVELCWQLGEHRVGYWHRIGEGYAGRRPIRASGDNS
jgi:hypothetical protein